MAEPFSIAGLLQDNIVIIIAIMGAVFMGVFLYKKYVQQMPKQPDFLYVQKIKAIKSRLVNVPSKHYPLFLYRGDRLLGRIQSHQKDKFKYTPTKEEFERGRGSKWEAEIETITYQPKKTLFFWHGDLEILFFKAEDYHISGNKLIIPDRVSISSLGDEYYTSTCEKEATSIIEADWSKRITEANVHVMASRMAHISAETPEMAHELSLKRLDIERIKAEKSAKLGNMI